MVDYTNVSTVAIECKMTVARIVFLAKYRMPHACLSMQWDHMLTGIDRTVIATPMDPETVDRVLSKHGINTANFEYVEDSIIYEKYPQVNNWVFPDDYRGWWLRQQAIKLSVVDLLDYDVVLLTDPDTFLIEPYQCYKNNRLNYMVLPDTKHGSYHGVFESITGMPEITPHCFVTEFVPSARENWLKLKHLLNQRWPNKHWLDAIIDAVPGIPTIPPWGTGNLIKWFSEYELIGNWATHCGDVDYTVQRRFEYPSLQNLDQLTTEYNAVADAIPDLSLSLQFDWETETVTDFEYYKELIQKQINK